MTIINDVLLSAAEHINDNQPTLEELEKTKALLHATRAELEEVRGVSQRASRKADAGLVHVNQELQRQKEQAASELNITSLALNDSPQIMMQSNFTPDSVHINISYSSII